jgi:hypothetical protein
MRYKAAEPDNLSGIATIAVYMYSIKYVCLGVSERGGGVGCTIRCPFIP